MGEDLLKTFINQVIEGHVLDVLRSIPAESVNIVLTSPPYWGLRDYGEETVAVWGGDENCEHNWIERKYRLGGTGQTMAGNKRTEAAQRAVERAKYPSSNVCQNCGAWRGQLGLEPHPQMYIDHLVEICRELRRVLRRDGSLYMVLGDTYYSGYGGGANTWERERGIQYEKGIQGMGEKRARCYRRYRKRNLAKADGRWLQPKQLLLIPSRFAAQMQEDGWCLRNDIIWHKKNHMPSSVKDRLTNSFEHIFHFVRSRKYWYDLDAIRQPHTSKAEWERTWGKYQKDYPTKNQKTKSCKQSVQSVWKRKYKRDFSRGKNPGDVMAIEEESPR